MIPPSPTAVNTLWTPPSPNLPQSQIRHKRSRAVSEIPLSSSAHDVNQRFIRAQSVRPILPPSPSSSFRPAKSVLASAASQSSLEEKSGINETSKPLTTSPLSSPVPRPIKVERFTPTSQPQNTHGPLTPVSATSNAGLMLPPPVPVHRLSASSSKRKADREHLSSSSIDTSQDYDNSHSLDSGNRPVDRARSMSVVSDVKPIIPIPILPIPLPSKRFKKKPTSKAQLIPVEQLPVFALPPLPTIIDQDLVKQVFTHSSLSEKVRWRFEDPMDNIAKHYEKLEHVGDSILGMVVTTWLHETRPNLTIGTATKLKSHLVSNATLSHLSGLYNFPQRLKADPNLLPLLRAQTDVRAALMEAYIAALYFSFPVDSRLSEGIQAVDSWLREMYEPLYDFFYKYMKKEHEQHHTTAGATIDGQALLQSEAEMTRIDNASLGMSALVQMYTNTQDRELNYEEERYETNVGMLWKIKCTVDGIELGEAIRVDKKKAKNVAAWEAAKKLGLTDEVI